MNKPFRLSRKSIQVLNLIAKGQSYAQIVDRHPELTYRDVLFAAEEAVRLDERLRAEAPPASSSGEQAEMHSMARAKLAHPRAYAPWSEEEDSRLAAMSAEGKSQKEIADRLQRQPSAIASRLRKKGLTQH